jgi:hypothetical protein
MNKLINRCFTGIFFGGFMAVLITNLIVIFNGHDVIDSDLFLKNSLASVVCGCFFTVSPLVFENKHLTLLQQTILHFLTVVILYFIVALTIGWIPLQFTSILYTIIGFVIIYIICWVVFYLYFKHQAHLLNEQLKKL